ncbi:MAG: lysophospholipase L1-like esterase [Pseudohongiellaceae bacterium]|jgi:lysophospholipase L1-like esterase
MPPSAPSADPASPVDAQPRAPRPSLVVRTIFAFLPLVVLLAGFEVVLRLANIAPHDNGDLSRGFDQQARYLVPLDSEKRPFGTAIAPEAPHQTAEAAHQTAGAAEAAAKDIAWITRIYAGLHPEEIIPPKGPRRRVLLMGGSNTRRLSEAYLEQRLNELSGPDHPGWEVFNLGREGYGSERVAILLRQALVTEPDVVVIYSGHNEFTERRFADEVDGALSPWEQRASSIFSQLRTFRLIESLWDDPTPPRETSRQDDRTPEEFQLSVQSFRDLTWDRTQRYFAAYRRNLTQMIEDVQAAGAEVLLCTLVSNDFAPPVLTNPRKELTEEQSQELLRLRDLSLEAEPGSPVAYLAWARRLRWPEWKGNHDAPENYQPPQLRPLSGRLAHTPATIGPLSSIAGAHWADPAGWSQKTIDCIAAYKRLLDKDIDDTWRAVAQLHVAENEAALSFAPDDPDAQYDLGICLLLLGEDGDTENVERAAKLLRSAAAADRLPLSANGTTNAIVRQVAAANGKAHLVDADQTFRACCPNNLVGFEVMMDHCHLQPGAGQVLLQDIADTVITLER